MKKIIIPLVCLSLCVFAVPLSGAGPKNKAKYEKKYEDPLLQSLKETREKEQAALDEETAAIRKRQDEEKKKDKEQERNLLSDMAGSIPHRRRPRSNPFSISLPSPNITPAPAGASPPRPSTNRRSSV
jgi:hypothetical protein